MECKFCGAEIPNQCGNFGCPNCHGEGLREYLAEIGRKGGQKGGRASGESKRRSPEHYAELSRKGVEARKRKQRKGS